MARKTIRVDMPVGKPEELMGLLKSILEKYEKDPKTSPLKSLNMTDFTAKTNLAAITRKDAKRLSEQSQAMYGESEQLMGIAPGQSRQSEGTLLYLLTMVRDQLLLTYRGNEDKLAEYGFKVSIGTAVNPVRKDKTIIS